MSSSPPPLPHGADEDEELVEEELVEGGTTRSDGNGRGGGGGGTVFSYGEARYWDARYVEEGGAPYDWYQRYAALRPFIRRFAPPASRLLMVGCGSALMSEDMVADGYMEIMNIDISLVVIEMMRKKYANLPQLQYMQMDVRDMSMLSDESFDCTIDKGTLDSLMCGVDAPISAAQMVLEVDRLLKPGGVFMLITYGDPSARVPHLNQPGCNWKIVLYILPRPGFKGKARRSQEVQSESTLMCMLAAKEPSSLEEALNSPDWRRATEEEMNSIKENQTWVPTTLPQGQKAIGLKWVFKVKKDSTGNIVKYKARMVAKGYAQRQGIDFDEVFAPVARMQTVRILIALAAQGQWEIHRMDVKSAFLNGELVEEVYVQRPPGFSEEPGDQQVLKLKKALYGLRQAPRA